LFDETTDGVSHEMRYDSLYHIMCFVDIRRKSMENEKDTSSLLINHPGEVRIAVFAKIAVK